MKNFIEEKLLYQVDNDNYFIKKKAFLLCEANILFIGMLLCIIIPIHYLDSVRRSLLIMGDLFVVCGLLISIFQLRKGRVVVAGMCTVMSYMIIPYVHNLLGDWLYPAGVSSSRYFETLCMLCFLFILIITFSVSRIQILTGIMLASPASIGHFFVLRRVVEQDLPYNYLLYSAIPLALGTIAIINLLLVNDAIDALEKSKNQVIEWNSILEETVEKRTQELMDTNDKLKAISNTDSLTAIYNRRYFDYIMAKEWKLAQQNKSQLALIIGDVDWFKNYNDIYGHVAGDECLKLVAQLFSDSVNNETEFVARYGGEEFVVIMSNSTPEKAIGFADRLLSGFHEVNLSHSGSEYGHVTVSLGVAVMDPGEDQCMEELVRAADHALYIAKKSGRNQYILSDRHK